MTDLSRTPTNHIGHDDDRPLLDCTSRQSALDSFSRGVGISSAELESRIVQIPEDAYVAYPELDPATVYPRLLLEGLGIDEDQAAVLFSGAVYHHATRCFDVTTFLHTGLLALGDVRSSLEETVRRLAGDHERVGSTHFTYGHRLQHGFGGPCGLLVRELHNDPDKAHIRSFLKRPPEAVEDLLAAYPPCVTDQYLNETAPVIVKFWAASVGYLEIRAALWFLREGPTSMCAGGGYEGMNVSIPRDQILGVEVMRAEDL